MELELELGEPVCDVRGMPAGDNNGPGWTHKPSLLPLVNTLQ